jgi:mercuric ion binding protein
MNFNKIILSAAITSLMMLSCKQSHDTNIEPDSTKVENITEEDSTAIPPQPILVDNTGQLKMKIEGMSCAVMCAAKIEKELAATPGVSSAKVDFDTKTASVKFDSKALTPQQLADKVQAVGGGGLYTVTEATAL